MQKVKNMKTRLICLAVLTATVAVGLASPATAEVRVSPNYRLNNDSAPFRGQDQPGLAVSPTNPNHVVAVNAYIPGCPPDADRIWSALLALVHGEPVRAPESAAAKFG